jgi:stearoyl-CoA desaturase (delta-9 desaturase)
MGIAGSLMVISICWWLAFFTNGEGYHNFHHAFGNDYRNGFRWYHWDPSKWMISGLGYLGLAQNLRRTPEAIILKARLETSFDEFRTRWSSEEVPAQLEQMRFALETKLHDFQQKLRAFHAWKERKTAKRLRFRRARSRYWKRRLHLEHMALEEALSEFRDQLRTALQRSAPSLA